MRKMLCILLLLLALAAPALAQTQVDEVRTQIGENYVAYPQLTGMADEAVQKKINDDIVLSSAWPIIWSRWPRWGTAPGV